jgi:glycosyltransferase involved in cell wall biosynthesis
MNLLILTNNPNRASFRQRIEIYLGILRESGINCEIARLPSGYLARQKLFKSAQKFDGVFLHKKKLNLLDAFWLRKYSRKIIYNFDDAVMYSEKNPNHNSWSRLISFRRTVKLADMVIVGSSYLAQHVRRFNTNVEILPIGLKVSDYKIDHSPKTDGKMRFVWIGSESTLKYLLAIKPVVEEIGSRFSNVALRIIGDEFFDLSNMSVEKKLWSQENIAIDLVTSDIGLAPLTDDRFTRGKCSFKVLEYSAAGLPVIASPVGTNCEYVREGLTGFFAKDFAQWVDRIIALIKDPQLRKTMGQQGRTYAQQFDVSIIGKRFAGLIKKCLASNSIAK